jgi:hypothetical protein
MWKQSVPMVSFSARRCRLWWHFCSSIVLTTTWRQTDKALWRQTHLQATPAYQLIGRRWSLSHREWILHPDPSKTFITGKTRYFRFSHERTNHLAPEIVRFVSARAYLFQWITTVRPQSPAGWWRIERSSAVISRLEFLKITGSPKISIPELVSFEL